ncbi:MAG: hypothetical protein CL843_10195 [Crocinitomicaceae bacterium]|nr:hypothetical protein [Crocinitomicaceae bacterium]|tara:strand:+ start:199 stop:441 length:243 start_codon:yes stop_codon:yes gene_type:complete
MARSKDGLTPTLLVNKIRENQNNNGTLKSLFAKQFLGKFSKEELDGFTRSIEKEISRREMDRVNEMRETLEKLGYKVEKK